MTERNRALAALEVFVGEWSMEARFEAMPSAGAGARASCSSGSLAGSSSFNAGRSPFRQRRMGSH